MNTDFPHKNPSLSEDLTVVLLRGNGSPRTFRFSLPALQRSLTALGFLFAFAVASAIFLLLLNLFHFTPDRVEAPALPIASPVPVAALPATPAAQAEKKEGFWGSLTGHKPGTSSDSDALKDDSEIRKEVAGLHEDVARLNTQLSGRVELANGANSGLLQFFGPRNIADTGSPIQVKNVKVVHTSTKEVYVDFELHNTDPDQRMARGYIVVLAKTPSFLMTYPDGVFSTSQNIVLDFTKGETYGVSRFRQARATFNAAPLEGKNAQFQVLLFGNDGKVVADLHVEDNR